LTTKSGHEISLTENHLIPIKTYDGNEKYLPAKDIQLGDLLSVLLDNKFEYSPIINKRIEIKQGYYAPITMKGTLLINNVLSSCFSNVKDHHLAQFYMFPVRFYYKFSRLIYLNDPFNDKNGEDMHWFIKIMFYFAYYFRPETLAF
jgi:intein/homing endonuclease